MTTYWYLAITHSVCLLRLSRAVKTTQLYNIPGIHIHTQSEGHTKKRKDREKGLRTMSPKK